MGDLKMGARAWGPLIGRALIASLFVISGARKAFYFTATAGFMAKLGMPVTDVLLAAAILLEITAGLMIAFGWRTRIAAMALLAFTIAATFIFHAFWTYDAAQLSNQLNHFMKNAAIAGALAYLATYGPGPVSVDAEEAPA